MLFVFEVSGCPADVFCFLSFRVSCSVFLFFKFQGVLQMFFVFQVSGCPADVVCFFKFQGVLQILFVF